MSRAFWINGAFALADPLRQGQARLDTPEKIGFGALKTDHYLIREMTRPFAAVLGILVLLFAGYSLANILSDAVNGLLPVGAIAALAGLKLLISLEVLIPISLFIAVVAAFGRLQADGEINAMLALGMGPRQLLRPALALALALAVCVTCLSVFARPWAYTASHRITRHAAAMLNVNAMEAGTFYASQDGAQVVFLGSRAGPHTGAQNVFIAKRDGAQLQVITANYASPAVPGPDGQRSVHLSGAHVYQFDHGHPAQDQSLSAAGLNLDPDGKVAATGGYSPVAASTVHLLAAKDPADIAERQWRFSTGLSTILLALLGAILSRGRPRQSRYAQFGPAILAYSGYYLLCTSARTWVQHGMLGSLPGLWLAPAILVIAMGLIWYAPAIRRALRTAAPAAQHPLPISAPPLNWQPAGSHDAA
ncbi:MAG: LPS export ABC transporter permease LptF [Rhodospirillales bacterium]|nr:LPS export ABC transporter permease LptF [Rhodospirillales bacterium]